MTVFNIVAIAIALAMDAFAVSISVGVCLKEIKFCQFFRLSWHFGLFQAMMPVVGWSTGLTIRNYIEKYDHWIAFILLFCVATNMIRDSFKNKDDECSIKDPTKGFQLVFLSVATSIDALAVGFSIAVLNISIWMPSMIIGITALIFTVLGLYIGSKTVNIFWCRKYAEVIGAVVLYIIGVKILYEHGVFV